jgi:phosphopantetheinyl transferase
MIVVALFSGSSSQSHYCSSKRRNIPEGSNTQQDRCENLKPRISQHNTADVLALTQQEVTFTYSSFAKSEVLPSALLKITVLWVVP